MAWSAPSHYLNQCWNIVKLRNTLWLDFKRNSCIFIEENAFESSSSSWCFTCNCWYRLWDWCRDVRWYIVECLISLLSSTDRYSKDLTSIYWHVCHYTYPRDIINFTPSLFETSDWIYCHKTSCIRFTFPTRKICIHVSGLWLVVTAVFGAVVD